MGAGDSVSVGVDEPFFLWWDEALGLADGEGLSVGLTVGEAFFFRRGETAGEAASDSASATGVRFFFGEALGDGVGDSALVGDFFFFGDSDGDGVDVGDFLDAVTFFFLCGVGVGVEKIFLSELPNDGSAASIAGAATLTQVIKIRTRRSMWYLIGRTTFRIS